jgi:hypothetical protein
MFQNVFWLKRGKIIKTFGDVIADRSSAGSPDAALAKTYGMSIWTRPNRRRAPAPLVAMRGYAPLRDALQPKLHRHGWRSKRASDRQRINVEGLAGGLPRKIRKRSAVVSAPA